MKSKTEFTDTEERIYLYFATEFHKQPCIAGTWETFIKDKNLGISYNPDCRSWDKYIITDQKKWTLSRIKYGF